MYTTVVIVSLLLICLVLVQPSKSGGMGAAFGGIGQSVFGAQAGSHLTKLTVIMTSIFFVLALVLAFLIGHRAGTITAGGLDAELQTTIKDMGLSQPAQPAGAAAGGTAVSGAAAAPAANPAGADATVPAAEKNAGK